MVGSGWLGAVGWERLLGGSGLGAFGWERLLGEVGLLLSTH